MLSLTPMNPTHVSFIPLLVVLGLSFLVPIVLSRVKRIFIPIVMGEIVAGMVVGPSGLGIVTEGKVLRILSELGFAFLMFLCGLEIDFADVLKSGRSQTSRWRRWISNHLVLGVAVLTIQRDGSVLVPDPNSVPAFNDAVTVAGSLGGAEQVIRLLRVREAHEKRPDLHGMGDHRGAGTSNTGQGGPGGGAEEELPGPDLPGGGCGAYRRWCFWSLL